MTPFLELITIFVKKIFGKIMEKYNGWTVLEHLGKRKDYRKFVKCQCVCGNIKEVELRTIKSGKSKSCSYNCNLELRRPELSTESVIEKYKELKTVKDTARFFMRGDTFISNILKNNNIRLYEGARLDPEVKRKKGVNKVMKYRKKREGHDFFYRFKNKLRTNIYLCFSKKGFDKKDITYIQILGCDWESVRIHFESNFKEDMSWENYGKWEIDHIIPNDSAITKEDVIRLSHISNLQPLWMMDNKNKGNKILEHNPLV